MGVPGSGVFAWVADELVQDRSQLTQPLKMRLRQFLHDPVAFRGQPDADDPGIRTVRYPRDQPRGLGTVDELDRAVRALQQVSGEIADGRRPVPRVALDRYQKLVLDVRQPGGLRLILAPALEAAQRDPELKQLLEVLPGKPGRCHPRIFHLFLVSPVVCPPYTPAMPCKRVTGGHPTRRAWA